jgi:type IV secretion system protein TrbL
LADEGSDVNGIIFSARWLAQWYADYQGKNGWKLHNPVHRRGRGIGVALWASIALLALYALTAPEAHAFQLFDGLVDQARGSSQSWFGTIQSLVRPTFMILAAIEICWAAAIWAFEKDSLNSLSLEIIKKIMTHGFFYALLLYAQDWVPSILNTFQVVGEQAAGIPAGITTDGIITMGIDVIGKLWASAAASVIPAITLDPEEILGNANPVAYYGLVAGETYFMMTMVTTLVVALAYIIVAAQFCTLKIESYVLFAVGAIFLGLGSNTLTKDWTVKYLTYAMNVGVRLLILILILSLTLNQVKQMADSGGVFFGMFTLDFKSLFEVMSAAVLQAFLGIKAPEMAAALLTGSPGFTMGSVTNTVAQVMNTVAMSRMSLGGLQGGGRQAAAKEGSSSLKDAVGAGRGVPLREQPDRSAAASAVSGLGGRGPGPAQGPGTARGD